LEIDTSALGELYDLLSALLNTNAGLAASIRLQQHNACSLESVQAGKICHNTLRLCASVIASAAFVGSCNWDDRGRRTCFWMMTCAPHDMSTHVVRVSAQNLAWNQLTSCGCEDNIV